MTADHRDLSNLIAPNPRVEGITLPPRRTASSVDPPAAVPPDPDTTETDTAPAQEPTGGSKPETPAFVRRKRPYPVYLPGALADRLKEVAGVTSYAGWVLDAYRHVHGRLADVFGLPASPDDSGLPPRPRSPRRRVEKPTALQLRMTEQEIDVLERKRAELGGPSKSEFITAVVELHLKEQ